jgi:hypothetical protein
MKPARETDLLAIGRTLSPRRRREWVNYGRYLSTQETQGDAGTQNGDDTWERLLADGKPRPKLAALAAKALAEHRAGKSTPLPRR